MKINACETPQLGNWLRVTVLPATLALLLGTAPTAQAIQFTNTTNGFYQSGGNWAGGSAPTSAQSAEFTSASGSLVLWNNSTGNTETTDLTVSNGSYTFTGCCGASGIPFTHRASDDILINNNATLWLGNQSTEPMNLIALDRIDVQSGGTLFADFGSEVAVFGQLLIGTTAGPQARVTINGSGSSLFALFVQTQIGGSGGSGRLSIQNSAAAALVDVVIVNSSVANSSGIIDVLGGSFLATDTIQAGISSLAGQVSQINVSGTNSRITQTGASTLSLGASSTSTATINITNGGRFDTGTGTTTINPTGTVNVTSGTFNANGNVIVNGGRLNRNGGAFNLATGRTLTARNSGQVAFTGNYELNNGTTFVIESGADFTLTDYLDIGNGSNGTLIVDGPGSSVTTNTAATTFLDWGLGGTSDVTIRNNGLATINASHIELGDGSASSIGIIRIESGGDMTVNTLELSDTISSAGSAEIIVTGSGSTLTQNGTSTLTVGGSGTGSASLTTASGGVFTSGTGTTTVNATGTLNISSGGTFNANGDLNISAGGTVNHTGGTLTINGGTMTRPSGSYNIAGTSGTASVVFTGAGTTVIDGGIIVADNASLIVDNGYALTGEGLFVDSHLEINNGGSYTGGDVLIFGGSAMSTALIDGGTLNSDVNVGIGFGAAAAHLSLADGGTLTAGFNIFTGEFGRLDGNGTLVPTGEFFNDGVTAPGTSIGTITVDGTARLRALGTLEIELDTPASSDLLAVTGTANIGGTLDVSLLGATPSLGDVFEIITAGNRFGTFATTNLPSLGGAAELFVAYTPTSVLIVAAPALAGDFNGDGTVDAADYTVWRDNQGSTTALVADANLNGIVDAADYGIWRANFGAVAASIASGESPGAVPEPATCLMLGLGLILLAARRTKR